MRYLLGVIVCAVFLTTMPADASSYGRVIYALTQNKQPDGPVDIFERNLDTGKTDLLIPHSSLPKDFNSTVSRLIASPDGKYLLLGEPVRKQMTLREAFGKAVTDGDQYVDITIGEIYWLWDRSTGQFSRITDEPYWYEKMIWSPSGRYLLAVDDTESRFWMYDTVSGNLRKLGPLHGISAVTWPFTEDSVIVAASPRTKRSVVYLQPLVPGKRTILSHNPWIIFSIAQSPDGSVYILYYRNGLYLFNGKTKRSHRLQVPIEEENFDSSFSFNRDGSKLVVFSSYTFGEPHVNWDELLWLVDLKKDIPMLLAHWSESYLGIIPTEGRAVNRELIGWAPDGKSILLSGQVTWGGEGATENRDDWFDLYAYDTTKRIDNEKELFSSGPGCLDLTWTAASRP